MPSCLLAWALVGLAFAVAPNEQSKRTTRKETPVKMGAPAPGPQSQSSYIGRHPSCANEAQRCQRADPRNNFQVLLCLQRDASILSLECHKTLWEFKRNMTLDIRLDQTLQASCTQEIDSLCKGIPPGKGLLVGCLLDHKRDIANSRCHSIVLRMQTIVFSDYHFIRDFEKDCMADIKRLKCQRIESVDANSLRKNPDVELKTQGATIACLEDRLKELSKQCKSRVLKKEEAAGDDVHLDVALFEACKEALEKFCADVTSQPGKMYDCLYQHKFDGALTSECKHQIRRRQKLEAADYKVDYSFAKACKEDIKHHNCLKGTQESTDFERTAKILICLDDAYNAKGAKISQDCMVRGSEVKERLFGDFDLNENLVAACTDVVAKKCQDQFANGQEGAVIECLMDLRTETDDIDANDDDEAQNTGKVNKECAEELDKLVERVDPASDFHIDHALQSACLATITTKCNTRGEDDSKVFSCLMERMDDDDLPEDCRKHLFHLQYFISRNFKLDHALYKACRDDALQLCHSQFATKDGEEMQGAQLPPQMTLACLYRHELNPDDSNAPKLSKECQGEVFRTLRERAISVKLNPAVERACMEDLVRLCPDVIAENDADYEGVEFDCLQKKFDGIPDGDCKKEMSQWTQLEAQDATIDRSLMKVCKKAVRLYCKEFVGKAEGELMSCLKRHKNDEQVTSKCKIKLEEFQEVEEKDISFDYKLKTTCGAEGSKLCAKARSRSDVLNCFASHMRDANTRSKMSTACRDLLKIALLEMNENIKHDSEFYSACRNDVGQLCPGIEPGEGKIIECLRRKGTEGKVSQACMNLLEDKEEVQANDPEVDYSLQKMCRSAIATLCKKVKPMNLLGCLIENKASMDDVICQRLVTEREIEAGENFRLDPHLREACIKDIPKFCREISSKGSKMIECLKEAYDTHKSLTPSCQKAIQLRERQAMDNPRVDAALYHACKDEPVLSDCSEGGMNGDFLSCLKTFVSEKKTLKKVKAIANAACMKELSRIMNEGVVDVHNDPLLFQQCAMDLHKFCRDLPFGSGKKMMCLLDVYSKGNLLPECAAELKSRVEMWDSAVELKGPQTLQDVVKTVAHSESRNSVVSFLMCGVVLLVVVGYFCGRKCRRRRKQRGKKQ